MLLWIFKKSKNTWKKIWIMKTCPKCNVKAESIEDKERIFGFRKINGRQIIIQSWCRNCRKHNDVEQFLNWPILDLIINNKRDENIEKTEFFKNIPRFDENGKIIRKSEKYERARINLMKQHEKFVNEFIELLLKDDPRIDDVKFIELFRIFDFDFVKNSEGMFFGFTISSKLQNNESQEEWKSKQNIRVILSKLTGIITDSFMKGLTATVNDELVILISLTTENPLEFSYNTKQIFHIDRDVLKYFLVYLLGKTKLFSNNFDGTLGFYPMMKESGKK